MPDIHNFARPDFVKGRSVASSAQPLCEIVKTGDGSAIATDTPRRAIALKKRKAFAPSGEKYYLYVNFSNPFLPGQPIDSKQIMDDIPIYRHRRQKY
jgi:hypothetical protein